MTSPGDPPTALEQRGQELGLTYARGRTMTPNSHLALEAGEFAAEHPEKRDAFHRLLFKAFFTDLEDISDIGVLVRIGEAAGLPAAELRTALETRAFEKQVDDGINWSRSIGVTAVPTFVIDEEYGVVGAQPFEYLDAVLKQLGKIPKGEG
jgi:predicted DsbA family dithiol-disulfide isomerase